MIKHSSTNKQAQQAENQNICVSIFVMIPSEIVTLFVEYADTRAHVICASYRRVSQVWYQGTKQVERIHYDAAWSEPSSKYKDQEYVQHIVPFAILKHFTRIKHLVINNIPVLLSYFRDGSNLSSKKNKRNKKKKVPKKVLENSREGKQSTVDEEEMEESSTQAIVNSILLANSCSLETLHYNRNIAVIWSRKLLMCLELAKNGKSENSYTNTYTTINQYNSEYEYLSRGKYHSSNEFTTLMFKGLLKDKVKAQLRVLRITNNKTKTNKRTFISAMDIQLIATTLTCCRNASIISHEQLALLASMVKNSRLKNIEMSNLRIGTDSNVETDRKIAKAGNYQTIRNKIVNRELRKEELDAVAMLGKALATILGFSLTTLTISGIIGMSGCVLANITSASFNEIQQQKLKQSQPVVQSVLKHLNLSDNDVMPSTVISQMITDSSNNLCSLDVYYIDDVNSFDSIINIQHGLKQCSNLKHLNFEGINQKSILLDSQVLRVITVGIVPFLPHLQTLNLSNNYIADECFTEAVLNAIVSEPDVTAFKYLVYQLKVLDLTKNFLTRDVQKQVKDLCNSLMGSNDNTSKKPMCKVKL